MNDFLARLDRLSGGLVGIVQRTAERVGEERVAEAAASMAYYGFFSLFPLLLVVVVIISTVLENTLTEEQILEALLRAFPFAHDLIAENIKQVLAARGSVGLIGFAGLAWAAMGVFAVLVRNISRAWPGTKNRNIFKMRLMALVMLAGLIGGLLALFVISTVMAFLPQDINHFAAKAVSSRLFSDFVMGALVFVTLLVLYRWLLGSGIRWRDVAWGALASAISIAIITRVFTWYLGSGLSTYNLVYGSLGAIVALLFWIYMLSLMVFVGAHLSAAIAYCQASPKDECGPTAGSGLPVEETE